MITTVVASESGERALYLPSDRTPRSRVTSPDRSNTAGEALRLRGILSLSFNKECGPTLAQGDGLFVYENPATLCGTYGASKAATSSSDSFNETAATASSRCCNFEAPMIGAVIAGFESIHAKATCARETPRADAISAT